MFIHYRVGLFSSPLKRITIMPLQRNLRKIGESKCLESTTAFQEDLCQYSLVAKVYDDRLPLIVFICLVT